jgi:hypothetical protein
MKNSNKKQLKCPSSQLSNSSELFGIINDNGVVNYLDNTLKVNDSFIDDISKNDSLETKFRFASKCIETGCGHWSNNSKTCSLAEEIVSKFNKKPDTLQYCAIRNDCRWYSQEGSKACIGCSFVRREF